MTEMWRESQIGANEAVREYEDKITELRNEIDALRSSISIKDMALAKLEWSGSPGFEECSWCGEYKIDGHKPDCLLSQALHTEGKSE